MHDTYALLSDILMCPKEALPAESTALRDIEGWDSLRHVMLVVELEKNLSTQLTSEEIQAIVTIADVGRVLTQKSVNA